MYSTGTTKSNIKVDGKVIESVNISNKSEQNIVMDQVIILHKKIKFKKMINYKNFKTENIEDRKQILIKKFDDNVQNKGLIIVDPIKNKIEKTEVNIIFDKNNSESYMYSKLISKDKVNNYLAKKDKLQEIREKRIIELNRETQFKEEISKVKKFTESIDKINID